MEQDNSIRFTLPIGGGQRTNAQPSSLYLPVPGQQHREPMPPLQVPTTAISLPNYNQSTHVQASPAYSQGASLIGYDASTQEPIWFSDTARNRGFYIFGKTGTGKSTLFLNLLLQDIQRGIGVCFVDPVGDAINDLIARMPEEAVDRVVLLDILHPSYTFGLNLYEGATNEQADITETHERIMHLFRLLWGDKANNDELGVRVRQYLSNSAFTLIENNVRGIPCAMTEIPLLFRKSVARAKLTAGLTKQSCIDFWEGYERLKHDEQEERADTQLTRVDAFLGNYYAEQIVGQAYTTVNFRSIMDDPTGPIVLIKLSNNHKELSQLVGAVIIANLLAAAKSRVATSFEQRRQFNVYADEYHLFATSDWAEMVEQARKFNVCVNFGHQRRSQLNYSGKAGALQTVNKAVLRVSGEDAAEVAREFDCSPQPGPPEEKPLKTPVLEPIQYIAQHKGVHVLPATRAFFERYARHLVDAVENEKEAERDYKHAWNSFATSSARYPIMPTLSDPTQHSRMVLKLLNTFFYQAMMAGKEGRPCDDFFSNDFICDLLIEVLEPYSEANEYLHWLASHDSILRSEENPVRDHVVRKWMIDNRHALLTATIQHRLDPLLQKQQQAEQTLQDVYRRYLPMEATAVRERIVIVQRGPYFYQPYIQNNEPERYVIYPHEGREPEPERYTQVRLGNLLGYNGFLDAFFASWHEAVAFYCQGLQSAWFQVGETLYQHNMWMHTRTKVRCGDKQVEVVEVLDTWVLRPGIEFIWATGAMYEEEITNRITYIANPTQEMQALAYYVDNETPCKKALDVAKASFNEARTEIAEETQKIPEAITQELAALKHEIDILSPLLAVKPKYRELVAQLQQQLGEVSQELARKPIEADSGLTREVPTEISSAEVERRIANDLTRLPDLTARTVLHVHDRPVEQTITIPGLPAGVDEDTFHERVHRIEQRTLSGGYYRQRVDVEEEIHARRSHFLYDQHKEQRKQQGTGQTTLPPPLPVQPPLAQPPPPPQKKSRKN